MEVGLNHCLAFDTSTERCAFALFSGEKPLFSVQLPFGIQSAQKLLPALQEQLASHAFEVQDLDCITVGIGPGSYTGIRVGVTVAKTLSFACNIPLAGICSLDGFLPTIDGNFAAIIDAKIGGVYMQLGTLKGGERLILTNSSLTKPNVYSIEDAAKLLNGVKVVVTPNADKIKPRLLGTAHGHLLGAIQWEEAYPSCKELLRLGRAKIREGKDLKLEPLYLRKTQAEIERDLS